jgi:hypothetical protein
MTTLMNGSFKAQILASAGKGATLGTITVTRADPANFASGTTGLVMSLPISPDRDWGYDVADYRDIDPDFGTLDDLDTLVRLGREAGHRGSARPGPQPHQRSAPLVH